MLKGQIVYIIFFIFLSAYSFSYGNKKINLHYNLNKPDKIIKLPKPLHEISGLSVVDNQNLACIQDEKGIIYTYNLQEERITHEAWFGEDGDYEGLALVGNTMYVLRSDGVLFEVENYTSAQSKTKQYPTRILATNNEGLFYDKDKNRLLIASKSNERKGAQYKDRRAVWSFDIKTKMTDPKPVYEFNIQKINSFIAQNSISFFSKNKITKIKFRPSDIAIHPFSKNIFILSAVDYSLFIFDNDGTLKHIEPLDPKLFRQAEGIAFMSDGTLYISNEGQDKHPTLLIFNYIQ